MRIYALVVVGPENPDEPLMIAAWDARMVEADPAGWRHVLHVESAGTLAAAEIVLEIPDEPVRRLLHTPPATLTATVLAPAPPDA